MAEYHVHCGLLGIYAGITDKAGFKWKDRSEVTDECVNAVAQFLIEQDKIASFYMDGVHYRMKVERLCKIGNDDDKEI